MPSKLSTIISGDSTSSVKAVINEHSKESPLDNFVASILRPSPGARMY